MRSLVAILFVLGAFVWMAPPAAAGDGVAGRPDPRATTCRRDFGWYPHYRYRCAPPGAACRPTTWRAPMYRRAAYCPNWYGPRCYGRPFPSRQPRSAYYRQVMGR